MLYAGMQMATNPGLMNLTVMSDASTLSNTLAGTGLCLQGNGCYKNAAQAWVSINHELVAIKVRFHLVLWIR